MVTGAAPTVPFETDAGAIASDPGSFVAASSVKRMLATGVTVAIVAPDFVDSAMRFFSGLDTSVLFDGALTARGATAADAATGAAIGFAGSTAGCLFGLPASAGCSRGSGCEPEVPSSVAGAEE